MWDINEFRQVKTCFIITMALKIYTKERGKELTVWIMQLNIVDLISWTKHKKIESFG